MIRQLDESYHRMVEGDFHTLESLWKARLDLLGKSVVVQAVHDEHRGRVLDVTLDGVVLEVRGNVLRLTPESIRHVHLAG